MEGRWKKHKANNVFKAVGELLVWGVKAGKAWCIHYLLIHNKLYKFNSLKKYISIISQNLWVSNLSIVDLTVSHKTTMIVFIRAGVSSEGSAGKGYTSKLTWLLTGFGSLGADRSGALSWLLVEASPVPGPVDLSSIVTWFPEASKRESVCKIEVIVFYNLIMEVTFFHFILMFFID